MWSSSQSGGGFMNDTQTPSKGSGDKVKKKQNVVPVMVSEVLAAPEEGFTVEGMEVGMVVICGKVTSVERAATKTTYTMEDNSGSLEVVQWIDEGAMGAEHNEGADVKVVGSVRTQQEKRHVMAFKITPISSTAEMDCHLLQVVYAKLKIRQLAAKAEGGSGMADYGGLSNSMMGGGLGTVQAPAAAAHQGFGHKNYDLVYGVIKGSVEEQGVDRGHINNMVRSKMSKQELDSALDFLSSEGHIYSTIDEDHFKTTDE